MSGSVVPDGEINFGTSEEASLPRTEILRHHQKMAVIDKDFQIKVLNRLILSIAGILIFDGIFRYFFHESLLTPVLSLTVPVFSFMLGAGSRPEPPKT